MVRNPKIGPKKVVSQFVEPLFEIHFQLDLKHPAAQPSNGLKVTQKRPIRYFSPKNCTASQEKIRIIFLPRYYRMHACMHETSPTSFVLHVRYDTIREKMDERIIDGKQRTIAAISHFYYRRFPKTLNVLNGKERRLFFPG